MPRGSFWNLRFFQEVSACEAVAGEAPSHEVDRDSAVIWRYNLEVGGSDMVGYFADPVAMPLCCWVLLRLLQHCNHCRRFQRDKSAERLEDMVDPASCELLDSQEWMKPALFTLLTYLYVYIYICVDTVSQYWTPRVSICFFASFIVAMLCKACMWIHQCRVDGGSGFGKALRWALGPWCTITCTGASCHGT
jgi:hypothetical protein